MTERKKGFRDFFGKGGPYFGKGKEKGRMSIAFEASRGGGTISGEQENQGARGGTSEFFGLTEGELGRGRRERWAFRGDTSESRNART